MIMSGNEAWNRNVFKRRQKVDRDGADITLSGRLLQMVGPATGKARPPTVDSFTDGTTGYQQTIHDWSEQSEMKRGRHGHCCCRVHRMALRARQWGCEVIWSHRIDT